MAYLLLGACGLLMAWPVWRSRRAVAGWIFLVTGGAISAGDLVVTGIFNWYEYRPGLLRGRGDDYFGVLTAECLFVPALYGALSLTPKRWRPWLMLAAVPFVTALEVLFLHLDIYRHHGWQLLYTIVLFLAYTLVAIALIVAFERHGYSTWHRAMQVLLSLHYTMNLWGLLPFGMLRLISIRMGLSPHPELDLIFSSLLLHAIPFNAVGFWSIWTGRVRQSETALVLACGFTVWLFWLGSMGWWEARSFWYPSYGGILVVLTHLALSQLDRRTAHLSGGKQETEGG
ncbi:MAG TPA: hypothetical protein VNT01_08015 [Symbiobacteriaceae bacterium]|nr:hypothetical protein [Symbiobacteriaceae bacterium]